MVRISPRKTGGTTISANGIARFLAAGFGSGWLPVAPGTFGSLVALLPAWWVISLHGLPALLGLFVMLLPVACWSTFVALPGLPDKDPGWVVIDEWLGQWLTLLLVLPLFGNSLTSFAFAFAAFRLFDIRKPCGIRHAERFGPAWWSIHADDLLAGVYAALMLDAGLLMLHMAGVTG